jgi:hypothetical protein
MQGSLLLLPGQGEELQKINFLLEPRNKWATLRLQWAAEVHTYITSVSRSSLAEPTYLLKSLLDLLT